MIVLHAVWTNAALHLWGERFRSGDDAPPDSGRAKVPKGDDGFAATDDVRQRLGDLWDTLLVSQGQAGDLPLHLPFVSGCLLHSWSDPPPADTGQAAGVTWETRRVPSLRFEPADAIDLLCSEPALPPFDVASVPGTGLCAAATLRFWRTAALLVLELLARQRFVPSIHRSGPGDYRGYWRAVVTDDDTAGRVRALIDAMPPACRTFEGDDNHPVTLVETFLWKGVDAQVRRCLESDELAHTIRADDQEADSLQMRWLRSLVGADARFPGSSEDAEEAFARVQDWLSRLEPVDPGRRFRTVFRLEAPDVEAGDSTSGTRNWILRFQVQPMGRNDVVIDAANLSDDNADEPQLLDRSSSEAREQLRADIAHAARHFPLLMRNGCHPPSFRCELTLDEAYAFLREAAPVLQSEGFGVDVPSWWHDRRARLSLRLNLRPVTPHSTEGTSMMGLSALVNYDWSIALGREDLSHEEVRRLAAVKQPLAYLRGRWIETRPHDVQKAVAYLEKDRAGQVTVLEAMRRFFHADDFDSGLPVGDLRSHGWLRGMLESSAGHALTAVDQPPTFHGQLRPYQLRGLSWLSFLSRLGLGGCLADDMGLGKTIQLIALLLHERADGESPGPTLLIVPTSLVGNWQREMSRFAPNLRTMVHHGQERLTGEAFVQEVAPYDAVISTYALTHRDFDHLSAVAWHRIVLDEAQNIKNPAAKQSRAIRALRATHRMALTGTPVENRLSELWSILDFLAPGYLSGASDFRRRFAVPIERYRDADRADRLRQLIRPFVLRRTKNDPDVEADLPEKMEMKVFCNLTAEQAGLYESTLNEMLSQIEPAGGIQRRGLILATLVKLKQVCNHPAHYFRDESTMAGRSGKCERLREMIEELISEGDRALVFTQFREMGALLEQHLTQTLPGEVLFLHGGTPLRRRDEMVQRFQAERDGPRVFILSLRAGGLGLNLTAANHVFHYDRWWNPAVENQATDRVHRLGQVKRVQVHKFICIGTLEERIDALLEGKKNLADTIVGTGEDWLTDLSTDQLRNLFSLSREAVAER